MAIQIQAHFQGPSASQGSAEPIVGIDLGTTNSLVAHVRNGTPEVLVSREGRRLIPSVVTLAEGKPVIGYAAKHQKLRDPSHTIFSVKRLLGRGFADLEKAAAELPYEPVPGESGPDGIVRVRLGDQTYTPIEISAMILREVRAAAEQALGQRVTKAVITVPAYFNDSQRQATRAAGRLAGLDVLRIVNEPTAAALAYGLDRKREGLIAVYDLGGGTFDVSILKLHNGIFEVLATNGNTSLGGDDLDLAIVRSVSDEASRELSVDARSNPEFRAALIEAAERLKISLSESESAIFDVEWKGRRFVREFTRAEFEALARPMLEGTRAPCLNALADAKLKPEDLSDVVLVGGPTRLPVVQEMAREIFGREPNTSLHPDEVVAIGAAIQADILAGHNKDLLLLDVVPLSLGIETYGGLMSPLIQRNTRIPTVAREGFTTFVDNQTAVDIHVLQGERDRADENRSLARFKLKGVRPMPAGQARVEVTFLIDADGILQVAARDQHTGNEQAIEVRPTYGLTDAEVEKMLAASHDNAAEDIEYRKLVEARNKSEPILRGSEKALPDARRLLPADEVVGIETRIATLKSALQGTSIEAIQQATFELDRATRGLADLIIKETIAQVAAKQRKEG